MLSCKFNSKRDELQEDGEIAVEQMAIAQGRCLIQRIDRFLEAAGDGPNRSV